jgi:biopolymer transport protein ExbD
MAVGKTDREWSEPPFAFVGRAFRTRLRPDGNPLSPAPFVDLFLLAILFLSVQSNFILQPGIRIRLPEAPFLSGVAYGPAVVTVSQEGIILFNDERTTLEGLPADFAQVRYENPGAVLLIEADERVPFSTLVRIYNMALEAEIREVALATRMALAPESAP